MVNAVGTLTMGSGGVPAGAYTVELVAVEPWTENSDKYGDGIVFKFKVLGGEHDGVETSRITGSRLTPKSALKRILMGLKGGDIEVGEKIEPQAFVGRRYMAVVQETDSGSTRVETLLKPTEN